MTHCQEDQRSEGEQGRGHASPAMLFTDLYELTMGQAYWEAGIQGEATFSLFIRNLPSHRGYFVSAGVEDALDYLECFRFTESDVAALESTGRFSHGFLDYLERLRFHGSARAMPEGAVFFPNEPVIEVTGPIIPAQMAETYLVNQVHHQVLLATKAARVVQAARGRSVVDFAARRTHGTESADHLARVAYMAGFAATSNVRAGFRWGIPTSGTMAHSFITAFSSELEAFRAYASSFPDECVLLVDTYDSLGGVKNAAKVARELRASGHQLVSIRLDSGDLLQLARDARAILDDAGLHDVKIFASGGLDEFEIDALAVQEAPIDGFGVGTKFGVSADAPWADCAYKLVEYDGRPVLKLSEKKATLPGPKQVFRTVDADGSFREDVIACSDEPAPCSRPMPLLHEVMRRGRRIQARTGLSDARERLAASMDALPAGCKALRLPMEYPVGVSQRLRELRDRVALERRDE